MMDQLEEEVDMLERHLHILQTVIKREPIGIVKMSNKTGYAHHKIRYSLRLLQEESLIEPTPDGAITTGQTSEFVDGFDENIDSIIGKVNGMKVGDTAELLS